MRNLGTVGLLGFVLLWFTVAILGVTGWVMNLITVFHTANDPITGTFILRCVGIIAFPIGAILGWF